MSQLDKPYLGAVYMVEENVTWERQKKDFTNMAEYGINMVVIWPPISPWDSEDGVSIAFDSIDRVMDLCLELKIKVVLEFEGQNPSFQFAPDYSFKEEHRTIGDKSRHWVNYYHPEVKENIETYITAVVEHFKDHKALWGYDVFNEVNFYSEDVYTENEFKKWLEVKYINIKSLNQIWKRFYKSFEDIKYFNIRHNYSIWSSLRHKLDYEDFRADSIANFVEDWKNIILKNDTKHQIIADNSWSMTTFDTNILGNDDWKVASKVDIFGLSVYPQSWDVRLKDDPCAITQIYQGGVSAGKKSQGKPIMVSELQTHNQTALARGSSVFDEIKLWTLQAFVHGVDGLVYWKWNPFVSGFQVSSRGMTSSNGTPNSRADQVKFVADILNKNPDAFVGQSVYDNGIGMLYDPNCDRFTDLVLPDELGLYRQAFSNWYRFLWNKGINPSVLKGTDINSNEFSNIKVLIISNMAILSEEDAERLKIFMANGGKIIADGRFAIVNENGFAYEEAPGNLVKELGYIEEDYLSPYDSKNVVEERFSKISLLDAKCSLNSDLKDPFFAEKENSLYVTTPFGMNPVKGEIWDRIEKFIDLNMDKKYSVASKDSKTDVVISYGDNDFISVTNFNKETRFVEVTIPKNSKIKDIVGECKYSLDWEVLKLEIPGREFGGVVLE